MYIYIYISEVGIYIFDYLAAPSITLETGDGQLAWEQISPRHSLTYTRRLESGWRIYGKWERRAPMNAPAEMTDDRLPLTGCAMRG